MPIYIYICVCVCVCVCVCGVLYINKLNIGEFRNNARNVTIYVLYWKKKEKKKPVVSSRV